MLDIIWLALTRKQKYCVNIYVYFSTIIYTKFKCNQLIKIISWIKLKMIVPLDNNSMSSDSYN